ncbi:hypothetical protein MCOR17_009184 [Pyricularia oryzae]|nr:hypothetical protein MCOR17_009184 [Pyricularia oryzae]
MAAAFRPANNGPGHSEALHEGRPPSAPLQSSENRAQQMHSTAPMDDATTPTRATFSRGNSAAGANRNSTGLVSQKPLPTSPFPDAVQVPEPSEKPTAQGEHSQQPTTPADSEDVDMNASEGEDGGNDDGGSDDDSLNADGTKSKNKKKSQRFYCTDYPPCNLSFTRSEHLARHIRKHTGERPFMCHCTRRFSRLDNLRQHAQTVHVNEDIPADSLAVASSRFVRQVRPDRVRPNGRARTGTGGGAGGPARGHSKSLSTSSIASIGSLGSNYSNAPRDDPARRRPPPLVMADPRSRLSLESYRSGVDSQYSYRAASPSDFSTPTSATFSTGQSSPRWASGMASPTTSHSRAHSMYNTGSQTPGRRLSVPSVAGNPFQSPHGASPAVGRPMFGPSGLNTSHSGVFSPSSASLLSSPTLSPAGGWSRRESMSEAEAMEWRRRTWHVDRDYNVGGSRLSKVMNVDEPTTGPGGAIRLPGIESFDVPNFITPPRRIPSPMMVDSETNAPPALLLPDTRPQTDAHRPPQWDRDMSLHRGLTRLDITSSNSPRDSAGAWASEANSAVQAQAEHVREQIRTQPTVRFNPETHVVPIPNPAPLGPPPTSSNNMFRGHQHTMSAPSITSRESKRHGWYHGPSPMTIHARINEGTEPREQRVSHVDRMMHPNFSGFSGFPARENPPPRLSAPASNPQATPINRPGDQHGERGPNQQPDTLDRFKTLVAAATGGVPTATAC